jgi:ATP-binding cassette subfamily B protein
LLRRPQWRSWLQKINRYAQSWQQFRPFLGAAKSRLVLLTVVSVVAGMVEAGLLALVATLASALSKGEPRVEARLGWIDLSAPLSVLFVVGVGMAIVRGLLQIWLSYMPAQASANAMVDLRRALFNRFLATSWEVQAAERDGHLQTLMGPHIMNASQAITAVAQGLTAGFMFFTLLASAVILSVSTAVVVITASVLLFFLLTPLVRRLRRHAKELSQEGEEHAQGMEEVVMMAEEIQVFGASSTYRESVDRLSRRVRRPMLQTRFLARAVPTLYQSLAFLLLVLALANVYVSGGQAFAELGGVVLIMVRSLSFGQQIQAALRRIDELVPSMDALQAALDHYEANPRQDGDKQLHKIESLGIRDVTYAYVVGEDVLKGISFEAHRGEAIGIVGPSGAGKSSIVQILLRLRQPISGALEVNGEDARSFSRADWQRRVSYVPQSPQLIWGTVADNIRFYRSGMDDEQVERAARQAHIHDEIMSWPKGYETVIGQRVSAISGGQRQRLCLARALAGSPDVLILDEPTSALDVRSEMAVQESLEQIKSGMLLFLVAHRLSTLSICDRVMVVVDGRLQAIDEPSALRQGNDFYREVTEISQRQGFTQRSFQ